MALQPRRITGIMACLAPMRACDGANGGRADALSCNRTAVDPTNFYLAWCGRPHAMLLQLFATGTLLASDGIRSHRSPSPKPIQGWAERHSRSGVCVNVSRFRELF